MCSLVCSEVNCQALYTFNQIVGNAVIGLASINLSLRTMAVWEQKWYIVAPLVLLMMVRTLPCPASDLGLTSLAGSMVNASPRCSASGRLDASAGLCDCQDRKH